MKKYFFHAIGPDIETIRIKITEIIGLRPTARSNIEYNRYYTWETKTNEDIFDLVDHKNYEESTGGFVYPKYNFARFLVMGIPTPETVFYFDALKARPDLFRLLNP